MNLILKPSPIHGVGVFAVKPIRKGESIPLFNDSDWKYVSKPKGLERRFCTRDLESPNIYYAPQDWNRMSIGWYLNESEVPNVNSKNWEAIRHIRAGEELTISYKNL